MYRSTCRHFPVHDGSRASMAFVVGGGVKLHTIVVNVEQWEMVRTQKWEQFYVRIINSSFCGVTA